MNLIGVEGHDVVSLLQEALNRRGDVKIEICAILNDTTGIKKFRLVKKIRLFSYQELIIFLVLNLT